MNVRPRLILLPLLLGALAPSGTAEELRLKDLIFDLGSADPAVREAALETLGSKGRKVALALGEELEDTSYGKLRRTGMLEALGRMGSPGAAVFSQKLRKMRGQARWKTLEALHDLGPDAAFAVPALIECVKLAPRADTRKKQLEKVGGENDRVRALAVNTLGRIGPDARSALPVLTRLMKRSRKPDHTASALRLRATISYYGITRASKKVYPLLVEMVDENRDCEGCLATAVFGLGELGPEGKEAIPILEELAETRSGEIKKRAKKALDKIHGRAEPELGRRKSETEGSRRG